MMGTRLLYDRDFSATSYIFWERLIDDDLPDLESKTPQKRILDG